MADVVGSAAIEISPSLDGFVRDLETRLRALKVSAYEISTQPDIEGFSREIEKAKRQEEAKSKGDPVKIPAKADLDQFQRDLVKAVAEAQKSAEARIPLTADGERLRLETRRQVEELQKSITAEIPVDAELGAQQRAKLRGEVAAFEQSLEINIPVEADPEPLNRVARAARQTRSDSDDAGRSLNAMGAVRFGALAAGISALIPVIGGVAAAAAGAGGAIAAIGGVVAIGGSGIFDSFKAMGEASASAGADAVDSAKQQQTALDNLSDAQQRLTDAQQNEQDALRRVTDARKDAKDALDNLNLSMQQGALSERGAELAYQRSVQRLQDVQQRASVGRATQLDINEAALGVDQAAQNITDVRVRNTQTARRASEANAAGVEGSPQVVAAQQNLSSAQQDTTRAARDLARAQEDLATQSTSAGASADKLAEALAKLSPNAREFVLAMQALGPAWTDLRLAVQDNLFEGLGASVTALANQHLPALKAGLSDIASSLNVALRDTLGQLGDLFTRLTESGQWQAFIDAVGASMTGMAPFLTNVVEGLTRLTTIIGPSIGPLFTALGEGINAISGPLGNLGAEFVTQITNLMPTLAQFISALAQGLQPVLPVLQQLLTALGNALIPILPTLSQFLQIIGNALVAALPVVSDLLVQLLNALSPLFQESGIGNQVLMTMAQVFGDLITAITPVVQEIANSLQPLIPILMEAFRQIAPEIGAVAIALGTALANALRDVAPQLPGLIESFTNMLVQLAPLLPKLTEFALQVLPPLTDAAVKLADPLQKLLDLFAAIFDWVDKLVGPLIKVTNALNSVTDNAVTRALLSTLGPFGATAGALMDSGGGGGSGDTGRRTSGGGFGDSGLGDAGSGGGGSAVSSMTSIVQSRFPGMQMTSGYRNESGSYHSTGQAADFSNGTDDTPEMQALANYIADNYLGQTLELIHSPFGRNIKNGQFVGDGMSLYGASTMAEHRNHVHWAVAGPVGAAQRGPTAVPGQSAPSISPTGTYVGPGAPGSEAYLNGGVGSALTTYDQAPLPGRTSDKELQTRQAQSRVDEANSRRNQVYANPNATQADKDSADLAYLQAQNSLESSQKSGQKTSSADLSLQGFGAKAGTIAANAVLGFFGLENSVLSSSNPYNRAANSVIDFYGNPQGQGTSGGYGYTPQNLPQSSYQGGVPGGASSGVAPGGATAAGVTPNGVSPNYTPGAAITTESGVKGAAQGAVGRYGWGSGAEWSALDQLVSHESGWNPTAQNPSSTAYGLFQFLDTTWATVGGSKTSDPALQSEYGARYIKQRYGSPSAAWAFWQAQSPHWYDGGGIASGTGVMLKNVIKPERVLDPDMTRSFDTKLIPILESMRGWSPRSPELRRNAPLPVEAGPRVAFYGTNVADYRGLVETADREAHKASVGVLAAL